MQNERFILLSDLRGKDKAEWVTHYMEPLTTHFDIEFYDCCNLGNIDKTLSTEESLHQQFINGGIQLAARKLIEKEKGTINVLGFSIGGTIAWKAGIEGLKINYLAAISSTRLRFEERVPAATVELYYGEYDSFKPGDDWLSKHGLEKNIYPKEGHEF